MRYAGRTQDVVLADGSGHERTLRRLTPETVGLEPGYGLERGGDVSEQGWLALYAARDQQPFSVLVDLADPARAPIIMVGNGYTGVRWGPFGEVALYCGTRDCNPGRVARVVGATGAVQVIDPEQGPASRIVVHGVQLHGGGPEIIWAADGSGFLHGEDVKAGVTPLDGGPVVPGFPKVLSRWVGTGRYLDPFGSGGMAQVQVVDGPTETWYRDELAPATPVDAQLAADGLTVWLLLDDSSGPSPRALLAHLTGVGQIDSVTAIPLPVGPATGFELTRDDTFVAIHLGADRARFIIAPVSGDPTDGAGVGPARQAIEGDLMGLVPASLADTWPGG
jgi:hypothetical protein